jgi:tRNA-splicing ligase RtcB
MFREVFEPERGQRVPVRIWARKIADDTVRQLQRMASEPYVVDFVAAMADAHVANGVAVGTVFATEHTVVPRALGGDLGCGMSAIKTNIDASSISRKTLEEIVGAFGRAIPTGSATHRGRGVDVSETLMCSRLSTRALEHTREAIGKRHLGTLGGGNHFLELDRDADRNLWILVHSGSRGLGAAVAAHHAEVARFVGDSQLAGLDTREEHGAAYLEDLSRALTFARANRRALARRALEIMTDVFHETVEYLDEVDIHHNFVAKESWFGRDLIVHRKGAVSVPEGARALVPGSMGTASYVVEGLGCPAAFGSCSHGAGRVMSRSDARRKIKPKALAEAMRRIVYPEKLSKQLVEEAPTAYRDITEVLEDQEDLVKRQVRLEPIAVLKG